MNGLSLPGVGLLSVRKPDLVEGDLIEHVDGSLWLVKGCVHTPEGYVALPRVVGGKKFKRYSESMNIVERYYAHYINYLAELGREVPIIPASDIAVVFRWLVEGRTPTDKLLNELLQLFRRTGLECGIAGSYLGNYGGPESDIDIHCLDSPGAYLRVTHLYSSGILQHVDLGEAIREVFDVAELLNIEKHIRLVTSKFLQGKHRGKRVTIRIVNCERVGNLLGPYISTIPIDGVIEVIESDYRTPAIMRGEIIRASSPLPREVYLLSHRIRFAELPEGALVGIRGYLRTNTMGVVLVNLDESDVQWIHLP